MQRRTLVIVGALTLAGIATVAGVMLVGGRALLVVHETGSEWGRTSLPDGGQVSIRVLDGPSGSPEGELQRRDAAGRVLWRATIEHPSSPMLTLLGEHVLCRVTYGDFTHHSLRDYDLATGRLRWEVDDDEVARDEDYFSMDGLGIAPLGDDALLEIQHRGSSAWLRIRELSTGAVRAELPGPALEQWTRLVVRTYDGHVYLERADGVSSVELDPATGALRSLAPADATSVCRTTADVVYRAPDGSVHVRVLTGAEDRVIGSLPPGTLHCGRRDARLYVSWAADVEPSGRSTPTTPELASVSSIAPTEGATGTAYALEGDMLVWGVASAWGELDLDLDPPSEDGAGGPALDTHGRLVARVVEDERFVGEEVGYEGGREASVLLDVNTGLVVP